MVSGSKPCNPWAQARRLYAQLLSRTTNSRSKQINTTSAPAMANSVDDMPASSRSRFMKKVPGGRLCDSMRFSNVSTNRHRFLPCGHRAFRRQVTVEAAPHAHMGGSPLLHGDKRPAAPATAHDKAPAAGHRRKVPLSRNRFLRIPGASPNAMLGAVGTVPVLRNCHGPLPCLAHLGKGAAALPSQAPCMSSKSKRSNASALLAGTLVTRHMTCVGHISAAIET